jgi:hypothetical protein
MKRRRDREAKLAIAGYDKFGLTPRYSLMRSFPFRDHAGGEHVVPRGFPTDGASFPFWLRYVPGLLMLILIVADVDPLAAFLWSTVAQAFVGYPVHGTYTDAAVAHDYLYSVGWPKAFADRVFLVMIVRRARALHEAFMARRSRCGFMAHGARLVYAYRIQRAVLMYAVVAVLGWPAYWSHRRRRAVARRSARL